MKISKKLFLLLFVHCLNMDGMTSQFQFRGYMKIEDIRPGQLRYASKNVDKKVDAAIAKGYVKKENGFYSDWKFDNNKSIIQEKDALPVIKGPGNIGYILVDGHHDVLSSRVVRAQTVPVKVADLSNLSETAFWDTAIKKNYIFPYTLERKKVIPLPTNWNRLQDDPNRYFAALAARKCEKETTPSEDSTSDAQGGSHVAKYPIWVKVGKDIPFIEFMISDIMNEAGIEYKYDYNWGKNPPPEFVEKVRALLRKKVEAAAKDNPIKKLKLIPMAVPYSKIKENTGGVCSYTSMKELLFPRKRKK